MAFPFLKTQDEAVGLSELEQTYAKGLATLRDIIAPSALEVNPNFIRLGKKLVRVFFVFTYPRYLNTNWFGPIINLDRYMDISLFIHPVDTTLALKNMRKKVAQLEAEISMREEQGMVRDPMLETAYQDLENLRDSLQQAREKLFKFGIYISIYGDTPEELDKIETAIRSILEARLVYSKTALYQQTEGFNSALPLVNDIIQVNATMNSGPVGATFPFVSADLTSDNGILYGINRHNSSLILFDRFSLENANTVVFGKSGGGKSYASKLEILRSLMLGADVIVIDPENEYQYLAETVGGSFFRISLTSENHINPFDLSIPRPDESPADILRSNTINLVGLIRIMLGGLTPEEDAVIDQAITQTYAARDITAQSDFSKVTFPTMGDLKTVLDGMVGAQSLAIRLEKYVSGSYSGFLNNPTNIQTKNKLVVFNVRDMEDELRPIAMYIVLHYIWNIVRSELKKRILMIDEAWWLLKTEDGASFMFGIAKRARKYYLGVTTITQDVTDFINSPYGKPIITNSSLQFLFKQAPANTEILQKTFNLTDEEKFLLLESDVGEGLFFAGLKHVAIKVAASYTEDQIITSDPAQLLKIEQAKQEMAKAETMAL
ncbi:conjugal transfer protein TraC [Candidatus Azambacteria bacterium RIFCSPHIGHO2_01_FULL_44_55]|uniref:Conjugal transfer protein TraC n=1 Tax=Candidatus Azambacteria bacterium RIFCSPLOWO2_02_FULL_44_14 TaxID=1797306 RepID=A0A1F5CB50_9BACT|nr:MAG: conjugal transfer protein TraC [Candidatus Azambacteria bacterium RIFCSPLOWO2_01_FULL_44_84]OGD33017.1 MAG: conjugal transfer protein TraC [Candidatus Azambacteria bacterium RIFCSPHIGHO2_02_FULL_45_18]OGD39813.1 MAG: conjugal transfer protein TraC [Candidatus Azambacteria bacterium RIFCSPHIGHO2_01_FULL_44_55]OGD40063.1 MAG: conjugal transfer protein TraC [Candidatus Azambacteria bacterium RIFCSPLOWO2_02_FULL_44_14]OGD52159.1 MAG: conjugal transfer protein TraC [Candidatus Azambacteria b